MSHQPEHHGNTLQTTTETPADDDLAGKGLSFDVDAGEEPYNYQIAIADEDEERLVGGTERDYFWGLGSDDQIAGGDEDDLLYGDQGADVLGGGAGMDRLDGGTGDDRLFGGDEADTLLGHEGDDTLDEAAGHGDLEGGPGDDILIGGQGPDAFVMDGADNGDDVIRDFTAGPGMFDHLALRDLRWEDLTIEDTDRGALVRWDGGSVLLESVLKAQLAQDDFMFADAPDVPPGTRSPTEGPTEERVLMTEVPEFTGEPLPGRGFDKLADIVLEQGGLNFAFKGDNAYQIIAGTPDDDDRQGGATADHFFGRDGDDRFDGKDGDDILNGDAGADELRGAAGMDRLDGGMGDDRLFGGDQADTLMGADGNDHLQEDAGHGMLEGGKGDDVFSGGEGADAFIVAPDSGNDVVLDFQARGDAQGAFDHVALRDISPDDVTVTDTDRGALVSWDVEGVEGSIRLEGVAKADLRQSDFMFVEAPGFVDGIDDDGSWYIFPSSDWIL
jgi:serralysin